MQHSPTTGEHVAMLDPVQALQQTKPKKKCHKLYVRMLDTVRSERSSASQKRKNEVRLGGCVVRYVRIDGGHGSEERENNR